MHARLIPIVRGTFVVAALAAAVYLTSGRAQAAGTCTTAGFSSVPGVAFGSGVDVYATVSILALSMTATCTAGTGNGAASFTIALDNGLHTASDGKRAMLCTSGCGIYQNVDKLEYLLCSDSACATPIANGGTLSGSCALHSGACTTPGTVSFWAELVQPVAGGVNDVSVGSYTDTVTLTITP